MDAHFTVVLHRLLLVNSFIAVVFGAVYLTSELLSPFV